MNPQTLRAAMTAADVFLQAAHRAYFSMSNEDRDESGFGMPESSSGKLNAAAKRASMDLSRALSEMRRSG